MRKDSRNSKEDAPDVRADEPERAMEQFTEGLRRVLAAPKLHPSARKKVKKAKKR